MAKKISLKTSANNQSVSAFLNSIEDPELRKDAKTLLKIFKEITKTRPQMWGNSIIGFGRYTYYRANGDVGEYMATGFSPRKSGPTLYIMPGYENYEDLLTELGPHRKGKSCLYLKKLANINQEALVKIIKRGLKDLRKTHKTIMKD